MNPQAKPKIAVVTDSTAYIPPELVEQYSIRVVPLYLILGEQTWLDGVEIDPPAFYQLLQSTDLFPSTSQPNVSTFQKLFTELAADYEGIVAVVISDDLSGTMDSATAAAANMAGVPIEIVDSRGTSVMLAFTALAAARAAAEGKDLAEVAQAARDLVGRVSLYFVVETLEYLHRGGRIGGAAKLLGSALNLKPILEIRDGIVKPVTKIRTRKKALQKLFELLEEQLQGDGPIHMGVLNVAAPDEAESLRQELEERFRPVEMLMTEASPAIGAHAGPGAVGVAFYTD
jgi:DegV family protein with EDD domain